MGPRQQQYGECQAECADAVGLLHAFNGMLHVIAMAPTQIALARRLVACAQGHFLSKQLDQTTSGTCFKQRRPKHAATHEYARAIIRHVSAVSLPNPVYLISQHLAAQKRCAIAS